MVDATQTILFNACICCRNGIWTEFDKIAAGDFANGKCTFLCCEEQVCCDLTKTDAPLLCGVPEGKICQLGCGCCAVALQGLELPKILEGNGHCLCCAGSAAFPFNDENPLMCALCFLSLIPQTGFMLKWADAVKPAANSA